MRHVRQRVTFGFKEKRRNQRRPVTVEGVVGGVRVDLFNLSFTGSGGRIVDYDAEAELPIEEGTVTTLAFTGAGAQEVSLTATIQRIDPATGEIGVTFSALPDRAFDTIEKLMFPPRGDV